MFFLERIKIVSILVLMDLAFEFVFYGNGPRGTNFVSILVLMDLAFE